MSWKEKMKEFGGGDLAFLSENGEAIMFVVVGEPVLLEGKFKGRPSEKIGCPIVTLDGFTLLIAGKRLARKISKYEDSFDKVALMAIRRGEQNDITTTYELKTLDDPDTVNKLLEMTAGRNFVTEIGEAVTAAEAVMRQ